MNELIRKLIRTKSAILFPGTDTVDCQIDDIEKFAELIIHECAIAMSKIPGGYSAEKYYESNQIIKQHFGVE